MKYAELVHMIEPRAHILCARATAGEWSGCCHYVRWDTSFI